MNVTHISQFNSATNYIIPPFCRPEKIRVISCKATDEFKKELSALNSKSANVDQVKKAYRKMALRFHPDVCDPSKREESARMFIELNKAYTNLLNQEFQESDGFESGASRAKWEFQLSELKRKSRSKQVQSEGSWGCRMRAIHQ
ncbi:hypothetical protein ACP275_03G013100 [Erythranthe tilingii]